jgi:hypothetical protein
VLVQETNEFYAAVASKSNDSGKNNYSPL